MSFVAGAPSASKSTIVASPGWVTANGTSTTTLAVTWRMRRQCGCRYGGHAVGQWFGQHLRADHRDDQLLRRIHRDAGVSGGADRDRHGD